MSKLPIPDAALSQHIAVLGKTGSGKTSTAKLIVEHVAARSSRVCILDPTKSDWWGMISSADGKKPGLPFTILGGPHGHVPLHAGAGAAIAELVASGALPLSIIDMSEFPPGGQAKFYAAFAPVLLRRMKGVLYLVKEEAHEFAPKERSGIGEENFALHYAKKIATAGRSRGIRMIACSQRVQALHNAVLGSCDTVVVHRMTAPADQEPVAKWLKGNVKDKALRAQIEDSLPNLKTGTGWVCSGEAGMLELVQFPRIATFDNSATPDDDSAADAVVTARVDQEKLRALIGDAVKDAEASDPVALKKRIAELERQLKAAGGGASAADLVEARRTGKKDGYDEARAAFAREFPLRCKGAAEDIRKALASIESVASKLEFAAKQLPASGARPENLERRVEGRRPAEAIVERRTGAAPSLPRSHRQIDGRAPANGGGEQLPKAERLVLTALAQYPQGRTKAQVAILTGYASTGGGFNNALSSLRSKSYVADRSPLLQITDAGLAALGNYESLPQGPDLLRHWLGQLSKAERAALEVLANAYPGAMTKEEVAEGAGYEPNGGGFNNALSRLRTLELISGRGELRASEDLFT